jgi:Uma2 family endonuclease
MGEAGIFNENDRVELINGEIFSMTPIGSPHAACVDRLTRLLVVAAGDRASVRVQNPIRLGADSEPQPDLTLLRPRPDFYARAHPGPGDVLVVIEVADTTLAFDRAVKVPLYARAGIGEVWLVDLAGDAIEVYRQPAQGRYSDVTRLGRGQRLTCEALSGLAVAIDAVLG